PKIEIKPIQKAESKQEQKLVVAPVESQVEAAATTPSQNHKEAERPAAGTVTEETGKSYAWLVMILVLAGILVGGWFYYNSSSNGELAVEKTEPIVQEQVPEPAPPAQEVIEAPVEEVETF